MFREKGAQTATANRVIDVIEIEQSRPNAQWTKHLNAETHKIFIHFAPVSYTHLDVYKRQM